jgi:hypothetical protein
MGVGVGVGSVVGEMDNDANNGRLGESLDGDYDANQHGHEDTGHELGHAALHAPLPLPVWITVLVLAVIGAKDPSCIPKPTANTLLGLLLRLLRENDGAYASLASEMLGKGMQQVRLLLPDITATPAAPSPCFY